MGLGRASVQMACSGLVVGSRPGGPKPLPLDRRLARPLHFYAGAWLIQLPSVSTYHHETGLKDTPCTSTQRGGPSGFASQCVTADNASPQAMLL